MRFKEIYIICDRALPYLPLFRFREIRGFSYKCINWKEYRHKLFGLEAVDIFKKKLDELHSICPAFSESAEELVLTLVEYNQFQPKFSELASSVELICEIARIQQISGDCATFELKFPRSSNISHISAITDKISRFLHKCPYIRDWSVSVESVNTDRSNLWFSLTINNDIEDFLFALILFHEKSDRVAKHIISSQNQLEALLEFDTDNGLFESTRQRLLAVGQMIFDQCMAELGQSRYFEAFQPEEIQEPFALFSELLSSGMELILLNDAQSYVRDIR